MPQRGSAPPDELAAFRCLVFVARRGPSARGSASASDELIAGNQSPISRSADSGESEPCTRLSGIESARSPRIVPGAASAGFVAPIVLRHDRDRALALEHERERRRRGDEVDELAEERLLAVLGVVLLGERRGRR